MSAAQAPKRMLVLCPYPLGVAAGQRLKFEQYYDDWRAAGWDVDAAPFMDRALWAVLYEHGHLAAKIRGVLRGYARRLRDLLRGPRYDVVYCHMYVTPLGTSLFERLARDLARRLIFDVEDNVLIGQPFNKKDHPNWLGRQLRGKGKAEYLIRTADHVITSSPALNNICRTINRKEAATYISSSLDSDRFVPAEP